MKRLLTATLALSFLPVIIGTPNLVLANPAIVAQYSAPRIDSFRVEPIDRPAPGRELVFTLEGTPNARVTVNIGDIARNLPAREVRSGYYEARYTIRDRDNFNGNVPVRADLQAGNRRVSATLADSLVTTGNNRDRHANLSIDRFTVNPVRNLQPGTELVFTLLGTPDATATYSIEGVTYDRPMREVSPGRYEGSYTIRGQDNFDDNTSASAELRVGNRRVSATPIDSLVATGNNSDRYGNLSIERFTVNSVRDLQPGTELVFTLLGTPDATATYSIEGVTYDRPMREVSPGRYEGSYTVRDRDVFSSSGMKATAALQREDRVVRARLDDTLEASNRNTQDYISTNEALPLEIFSPANNSQVGDRVEVSGRSAPNATITVNVIARNSVIGLFGVERNVLSRTIQADDRGNFSLSFQPSGGVPGTRYEISLSASKGERTNQETLVLVQQ
ncbi:hypothetical protein V0288_09045 [Pannus brasiliensis CCIBt3594]|uniref:Uncharacterized protein n=1 Tax=Pannus brasiliensis CCIBt3594 TaxID=1427578 RepID=A0AAW9QJI8_9CHRO